MDAFVTLFVALDATTKTNVRQTLLAEWFRAVEPADAAWSLFFLSGRKLPQPLPTRRLRELASRISGVAPWLFDECYAVVGDLAETVALLLPERITVDPGEMATSSRLWSDLATAPDQGAGLSVWVEKLLLPLRGADAAVQEQLLRQAWNWLGKTGRFLWNKLLTGGFRVGVSQTLVTRALAEATALPVDVLAHRLAGDWFPSAGFFADLVAPVGTESSTTRPYPLTLANPLAGSDTPTGECSLASIQSQLGDEREYLAEWKWDGIRAQLLRRGQDLQIWSRGDELLTERFPELHAEARKMPAGTVLDGEIVAWRGAHVLPFTQLQQRIHRKQLSRKLLAEVPCVFIAFDLLEQDGQDLRARPLSWRRRMLEELLTPANAETRIRLAEAFTGLSLQELADLRGHSRQRGVEGLMLKHLDSPYVAGRATGAWWKWKIDPYTVDAVLVAAQVGHGRRASLFTDYTFAVWEGDRLVPFAKAYSGLTDEELKQIDAYVRKSTIDKFGPVRSVTPELVFELAFENLQRSSRHKSGIAVRFPRILRIRHDKSIRDADTLERILALLPAETDPAFATSRGDVSRELSLAPLPPRQRTFAWTEEIEGPS